MKPEAWAALKALQRANKQRVTIGKLGRLDQMLISAGRAPKFGTDARSRKPARKAREKAKKG